MVNFKALTALKVVLHNAVASLPVPTNPAADGAAITSWRLWDGYGPGLANLRIGANTATSIGVVGLYGVDDFDKISFVALLNNGSPIDMLDANVSFSQEIAGIGAFKRLVVGAVTGIIGSGTPAPAANITVDVTPLSTREHL